MVQETGRIIEHIETEREQLGENLEEIESRIKVATDPKAWFQRNPGVMLGAAAASGLVLGLLMTSRPSRENVKPATQPVRHPESRHLKTVKNTFDAAIAALMGLGARKIQDLVSGALPGFREQYTAASQRQAAWDAAEPRHHENSSHTS